MRWGVRILKGFCVEHNIMMGNKQIAKITTTCKNRLVTARWITFSLIISLLLHVCHGNVRRGDLTSKAPSDESLADVASFVDSNERNDGETEGDATSSRRFLKEDQPYQRQRRLPSLVSYGGDPDHSPLLRCEGDCDKDNEYADLTHHISAWIMTRCCCTHAPST